MFEPTATQDPAGFLAAVTEQLANLGRTKRLVTPARLCAHHPPPRSAGGTPTYAHQRGLTAAVTAHDVTRQT